MYIYLKDNIKEIVVMFYILGIMIIGITMQSLQDLFSGLKIIFTTPGILVSDYMEIAGVGPSLVNGALVGVVGFLVAKMSKARFSGPVIAPIFTMMGFGFFGKTFYSIIPIIFGVYIYSKIKQEPFKTYIVPALFGTALAPLVTQIAFGFEWGIVYGILIGIISGLIIPPFAIHLLNTHKGYNLYNVGFSAGIVGLLVISVLRSIGLEFEPQLHWGSFNEVLVIIFGCMFFSMIFLGLILKNKISYREILKQPGTLVTDFVDISGFGNTLINMGFVGIIGCGYVLLVGGYLNGPTMAGVLMMVGFAAFGKHPKNIIPVMIGVYVGCLLSNWNASDSGAILAALFGTTLAPFAGKFGFGAGVIAGFIHLTIVNYIGILHGGVNLYNNGFSAGFVAIILVVVFEGFKKNTSLVYVDI